MRTFKEWQREYIDDFWIMDPDGFPRNDPNFDNLLYTREDFLKRVGSCTCKFGKKIPEDIKNIIKGIK